MMNSNEQPVFRVLPELMQGILATSVSMSNMVSTQLMESMDISAKAAGVPLSQCDLWQQLFDYYSQKGISAWEGCVPFLVTNSTYMTEGYADMIVAFLKDYQSKLDLSQPLYIIELSAGTGRFTFNLLRDLFRKLEHFSSLAPLTVKYVMTDITESHVEFWEQHEKLKPYIDAGILDFAVHTPVTSDTITLRNANITLTPEHFKNPAIVFANYLFDTVPHDLFRVENGILMEGLATLENADAALGHEINFSDMKLSIDYHPAKSGAYYDNHHLNLILEYYTSLLDQENLIIPIGAFNCIKQLQTLTNRNMVLISSDKGYTSTKHFRLYREHTYATHGSLSFPVNYDALNQYYQLLEKPWFVTDSCSASLASACYLDVDTDHGMRFENLSLVFSEKINRLQPSTSLLKLHTLTKLMENTQHREMITIVIGMMKSACYEPQLFCELTPFLLDSIHLMDQSQTIDILEIMLECWDRYYYFKGECPLPFCLAQVYERLNALDECIYFLNESIRYQGRHEALLFLIGDCQERMNRIQEARQCFYDAIMLKPDFQDAHDRFMQLAC